MEVNLGDKLTYQMQLKKAYEDQYEWESKYRLKLQQEKAHNRSKFRIYVIVLIVLMFLISICHKIVTNGTGIGIFANSESTAMIAASVDAIGLVVGSIVLAFSGIGSLICLWKVIYYGKRQNKERDNRDCKWRTYSEMLSISKEKSEQLLIDQEVMTTEIQKTQALITERMERARLVYEEKTVEEEHIDVNELMKLKAEKEPVLVDNRNPLVRSW